MRRCCDNCAYYSWYYDYCNKWDCEVDDRSVCGEWKRMEAANERV